MSEAFHESQNGHHERVKELFTRTSKFNTTSPTDTVNTKNTIYEISKKRYVATCQEGSCKNWKRCADNKRGAKPGFDKFLE